MLTSSKLTVAEGTQAYTRLKAEVHDAGILDRSYIYYFFVISLTVLGFFASLGAIVVLHNYLYLTGACIAFSFFSVQMAGVNHDAGHRAVFKSKLLNNILGLFTSMCVGIVFENWRTRHNAHHAYSNQVGSDPDLEIPFIATDEAMADAKTGLQRWLVRYQAYYFYPLGMIVSFSNRLGSMSYFIQRRSWDDLGRFALYIPPTLVLFVLPFVLFSPVKALFVFGLVHAVTGVYLATCFAPNHKAMPTIGAGVSMSFLEQQVLTSRNVFGSIVTDVMLVGLNWQTEHHLFPATPRNKLYRIAPMLQQVCAETGIPYTSTGFIDTNKAIWRQLYKVQRYAASEHIGMTTGLVPEGSEASS